MLLKLEGENTIPDNYLFQCAPLEEMAVETAFEHSDFMTVGDGEFSRPQGTKLRTLAFETLIVPDQPSFAGFSADVGTLSNALVTICQNGSPFRLVIVEPTGDVLTDMNATLRTLRLTDKAGEPGTKYVSVAFSEYRSPTLTDGGQDVRPGSGGSGGGRVPNTFSLKYDKKDKTWWVKVGHAPPSWPKPKKNESIVLRAIALAFYKDADQWRKIRDANPKLGNWGGTSGLEKHSIYGNGKKHQLEIPE